MFPQGQAPGQEPPSAGVVLPREGAEARSFLAIYGNKSCRREARRYCKERRTGPTGDTVFKTWAPPSD